MSPFPKMKTSWITMKNWCVASCSKTLDHCILRVLDHYIQRVLDHYILCMLLILSIFIFNVVVINSVYLKYGTRPGVQGVLWVPNSIRIFCGPNLLTISLSEELTFVIYYYRFNLTLLLSEFKKNPNGYIYIIASVIDHIFFFSFVF